MADGNVVNPIPWVAEQGRFQLQGLIGLHPLSVYNVRLIFLFNVVSYEVDLFSLVTSIEVCAPQKSGDVYLLFHPSTLGNNDRMTHLQFA